VRAGRRATPPAPLNIGDSCECDIGEHFTYYKLQENYTKDYHFNTNPK